MYSNELTIEQVSEIVTEKYVGNVTRQDFISGYIDLDDALRCLFWEGWWFPSGVTPNEIIWEGKTIKELITYFYQHVDELPMVEYNGVFYVFPEKDYYVAFGGLNQGHVKSIDISIHRRVCINDNARRKLTAICEWVDVDKKTIEVEAIKRGELLEACNNSDYGWTKVLVNGQVTYVHISCSEALGF